MERYLVYFFKIGDALTLGQCKGIFYNRIRAYQTHSPYPVELLGVIECKTEKHMRELEMTLIKQFSEHNLRGEWFELAPEILTYIQDHADYELGQKALADDRERRRERRKDPEFRRNEQEYHQERRKDPEFRERKNACDREYKRERRKDPEYRERKNACNREYQRERRKDPEFRERQRERRKDPEYREREREYQREYYARKKA